MNHKDKHPEEAAHLPNTTGSPLVDSPHLDSAQTQQTLRWLAEEVLRRKEISTPENLESMSSEEQRRLLHELGVYQIELELQNEELRRSHMELEASRTRYFDLYDLAPAGYCTVSEQGLILEANLTAGTLLGVARSVLVRQPFTRFILNEDQDIYYRHRKQLFESGNPQTCELRMVHHDGTSFWAHLAGTIAQHEGEAPACRLVLNDITQSKHAEEALQKALENDIKTLRGIIPICANCKNIRDDQGYWNQVDAYISKHTGALFSHGICPECEKKLYPECRQDNKGMPENEGGHNDQQG
jgi:PAS domain S-box-containing protein